MAKTAREELPIPTGLPGRTRRWRDVAARGQGKPDEQDDAKATAARRWIAAVNEWGKLGRWHYAICAKEAHVPTKISEASESTTLAPAQSLARNV